MIVSRYERPMSDPNLNPVDEDDDCVYCAICDDFHEPDAHIADD